MIFGLHLPSCHFIPVPLLVSPSISLNNSSLCFRKENMLAPSLCCLHLLATVFPGWLPMTLLLQLGEALLNWHLPALSGPCSLQGIQCGAMGGQHADVFEGAWASCVCGSPRQLVSKGFSKSDTRCRPDSLKLLLLPVTLEIPGEGGNLGLGALYSGVRSHLGCRQLHLCP